MADNHKLAKSICKITNDVRNSNNDSHDILIGNFGEKIWSSIINDIVLCTHGGNAVAVTDFKEKITEMKLRKVTVGLVVGINEVSDRS